MRQNLVMNKVLKQESNTLILLVNANGYLIQLQRILSSLLYTRQNLTNICKGLTNDAE